MIDIPGTTIRVGDCLEVMHGMAENSVDAIVTDPPYGLEFMGKAWDAPWKGDTRQRNDGNFAAGDRRHGLVRHGMGASYGGNTLLNMQSFQDWCEAWACECLRVLKPGGYMLAFSGSRTYHRTAAGIENAGFEIRDQIMWVYGSGFPKSHNGPWGGTALKPAHEPIVMARKPLAGTVEANWHEHGTGALNIDACRVDAAGEVNPTIERRQGSTAHLSTRTAAAAEAEGKIESRTSPQRYQQHRPAEALGRWPANLIHDGSAEVLAEFPDAPGQQRDTGPLFARTAQVYGEFAAVSEHRARGDSGSAARFFYCAKASREDRNDGLDFGPVPAVSAGATMRDRETADWSERNGNHHPTVKPTNLMRYLCRLVTPAGGLVLDPFMGSGSTGKAAVLEGFQFIGIELDPAYAAIAEARIRVAQPGLALGDAA